LLTPKRAVYPVFVINEAENPLRNKRGKNKLKITEREVKNEKIH